MNKEEKVRISPKTLYAWGILIIQVGTYLTAKTTEDHLVGVCSLLAFGFIGLYNLIPTQRADS